MKTCKQLNSLLLPMLYHDVVLNVRQENRVRLTQFFALRNKGVKYIHSLTFEIYSEEDAKWTWYVLLKGFRQAPPCDSLRKISCDSNIFLLAPKMRQLLSQRHDVGATVTHLARTEALLDHLSSASYLPRLTCCQEMTLHFGPVGANLVSGIPDDVVIEDSKITQDVAAVWNGKHLRAMRVNFGRADQPIDQVPNRAIFDTRVFLRTLSDFHDSRLARYGSERALSDLTLRGADLGSPMMQHWQIPSAGLDAFAWLTTLVLQDCTGCCALLTWLPLRIQRCRLRRLVVISKAEHGISAFGSAVEGFLMSFEGLHTLIVSAAVEDIPGAHAVTRHAQTLKVLYLGAAIDANWRDVGSYVDRICAACVHLEQVALPMSRMSLRNVVFSGTGDRNSGPVPSTGYSFGTGTSHAFMGDKAIDEGRCEDFVRCLTSIAGLRNLITLRILDVDVRYGTNWERVELQVERLKSFLKFVLRKLHNAGHSRLTVLAMGRAQKRYHLHFLIRGSRLVEWNAKWSSMSVVTRAHARAEKPRSEILDIGHDMPGFVSLPMLEPGLE